MERPSPTNRLTDDELINQSLTLFEDIESTIDDVTSRMIASQFHPGMASDLYSLASTGHINPRLMDEIDRAYTEFHDQPEEQRKIAALAVYVAERMSRNDVKAKDGWSTLWLEQPAMDEYCQCCHEHISNYHRVGCPLGTDDEQLLRRVQQLQTEHGTPVLKWLEYVGFRDAEELELAANQFQDHYHGKWESLRAYAEHICRELDNPPSVEQLESELEQQMYVTEAFEGGVYVFDR